MDDDLNDNCVCNSQTQYFLVNMSIQFGTSFCIRPDTYRVNEIKILSEFINEYPDEELTPNLIRLGEKYKYYRPICGDGNCFYRACIFLYFSTANLEKFESLFPYAPIKDCENLPFEFDEYNVEQVLNYIWKEYLLPMRNMDQYQRKKELMRKLNGSLMLDAFLIAYFRSLNHQYLKGNREKFVAYIEGDVDNQLAQVLKFGRQSQGIELFAMAELLRVRITIMMVHKENFQQIVYLEQGKPNFVLFYRPGHYDILCDELEFRNQGSSNIRNQSNIHSSLPTYSSKKAGIQEVVRINSIQDYEKYGVKNSFNGKGSKINQKLDRRNLNQFYQIVGSAINKKNPSPQKPQKSSVIKKENKSALSPKKTKGDDNLMKKSQFKPASLTIPNVNPKRMIVEGVILTSIIGLIVGTLLFH